MLPERARQLAAELSWPPTDAYFVHRLNVAIQGLALAAERFGEDLKSSYSDLEAGEYELWVRVHCARAVLVYGPDFPDLMNRFRGRREAETRLRRILDTIPTFDFRLPPADSRELARRLSGPEHVRELKAILDRIPDPLGGPSGPNLKLFEWASFHLGPAPEGWSFDAPVPTDLLVRWRAALGLPEGPVAARRGLLLEAGLLRGEAKGHSTDTSKADTSPLTLDDEAVALLTRWMKEGRPKISKRAIAKALGRNHTSLRDCPTFKRLWEVSKSTPKRGHRNAATGNIETADEWG